MATIRIPTPLRKLTQGKEEVTAAGATVGALIASLETQYPGIRSASATTAGQVRRFVNIFANDEDIRFLKNLDTPVKDSDEISIVPAIAGGDRRSRSSWTSGQTSLATRARSRCPRSAPTGQAAHLAPRASRSSAATWPPRPRRRYLAAAGVGRCSRSRADVAAATARLAARRWRGVDLIVRARASTTTPMLRAAARLGLPVIVVRGDADARRRGLVPAPRPRRPTRALDVAVPPPPDAAPTRRAASWPGRWPRRRRCS